MATNEQYLASNTLTRNKKQSSHEKLGVLTKTKQKLSNRIADY